jgi:Zn-dependent protease with chaperone function
MVLITGTAVSWFRRLRNAIKNVSLFIPVSDEQLHLKLNRAITAIERLTNYKLPEVKIFNSFALGEPLCFTKGWLRPKIWIADTLVSEMNEDDLQVILSHEHCHVLRYDNLTSHILTFISELSWANLGCRTLLKGWYERRELFCDNFSARIVASRQKVASTLVKFAEIMMQRKGLHTTIPDAAFYYMHKDKPFIQTRVENLLCIPTKTPFNKGGQRGIKDTPISSYRYKLWFFALFGFFMLTFVVAVSITHASRLTSVHCLIENVFSLYCSAC